MTLPKPWLQLHAIKRDTLHTLHQHKTLTGPELCYHIGQGHINGRLSKGSTHEHYHELERNGLIEIEEHDGRTDEYQLTQEGRALVESVLNELTEEE